MTKSLMRAKLGAFAIHLTMSVLVISAFMILVTQFWFPGALFELENVWQGLRILIPVDAIMGPLLTLVIFAPGKKGLKLDLSIIVTLQVMALSYGAWAIQGARPEVLAWVGDRFEVITTKSIAHLPFPDENFKPEHTSYPLMVYPLPAQTNEELTDFVLNNVQYQLMPDRYQPLANYKHNILENALDIEFIKPESPDDIRKLNDFKTSFDAEKEALFILQGTTKEFIIMALDMDTLRVSDYLELDPWETYKPAQM